MLTIIIIIIPQMLTNTIKWHINSIPLCIILCGSSNHRVVALARFLLLDRASGCIGCLNPLGFTYVGENPLKAF